jgi:hypothetical protein
MLRGWWCHIIAMNTHAPTEDKIDDMKDSFYEELERLSNKFHKYHTKRDLIAKVSKEDFLNRQLGLKVFTKLVMTMDLPQLKISRSKVQCSHMATSTII